MLSLDSSLCLSETTKENLEVDENAQSPAVSPISFQSCSKTAGTAELEDELVGNVQLMTLRDILFTQIANILIIYCFVSA